MPRLARELSPPLSSLGEVSEHRHTRPPPARSPPPHFTLLLTPSPSNTRFARLGTVAVGSGIVNLFEPGWRKTARRKLQNIKEINSIETQEQTAIDSRIATRQLLKQKIKVEEVQTKVDRTEIAETEPTAVIARELKIDQEVEQRAKDMEEFLARREREVKEKARVDAEKKAAEEEEERKKIQERRDFAQAFWKDKEREYHDDAHEIRRLKDEETARQQKQALDMDKAEKSRRNEIRTHDQSHGPVNSTTAALNSGKSMGIFGIPYGNGEFASEYSGGHIPGVDDQTVELFQRPQQTKYEEDRAVFMQSEAEEGRAGDLYESLKMEIKSLQDELNNTQQLRSRLSTESEQNATEMQLVLKQQSGPPRRDPTPDERVTTHVRKNRARELAAELSRLSRKEISVTEQLNLATQQSGKVAAKISGLRTKNKELKQTLEEVNGGFAPPPMVVGRQINKVVDPFLANPVQTYQEIQHHSRLEIIKSAAQPAVAAHKEARMMDHGVWVANEQMQNERVQVEGLLTRLAGASERLKKARSENAQADLMEALRAFFLNNCKLDVVDANYSGTLNWWQHRAVDLSFGVDQLFSNDEAIQESEKLDAVKESLRNMGLEEGSLSSAGSIESVIQNAELDENAAEMMNNSDPNTDIYRQGIGLGTAMAGNFMGLIELPKFAVWTIEFVIVKRNPNREEGQGDPADWVTVKLGTALKNVSEVKVVRNLVDEETGELRHEIKHTIRCKDLAYKFEFASSSANSDEHFWVERGSYSQKSMEPLEVTDIETGRVLSDYVKQIRIEEKQGKLRSSNLVTELIAAEEDKGDYWDSGALFGVFQKSAGVKKSKRNGVVLGANATVGKRGRDSGGVGFSSRYPKEVFIGLVKEELEKLREEAKKEEEAKGITQISEEDIHKQPKKKMGMTKKQQHEFNLNESKRKFLVRKREKYDKKIEEAKRMQGANIEIFDHGTQAWEHMTVLRCVVKWVENGTKPLIEHEITRIDGQMKPTGDPFMLDLNEHRFYVSKEMVFDADAQAKWADNEKARKVREKEDKQRLKAAEREERKKREAAEKEAAAFENAKEKAIEKSKENAEVEANKVAKMKATKTEIGESVKSVYHELRVGIGGDAKKVSMSQARREAERRWKAAYVEQRMKETEAIWASASAQRVIEEKNKEIRAAEERAAKEESDKKALEFEREKAKAAVRERTNNLKATLSIKNFEKAVPKAPMCEHMRVRNWGDCYGKGLRCLDCGKEMTETDNLQGKGIGSGEDPQLVADVTLHRQNESSFRFKDGDHLRRVENERARLEKERREMAFHNDIFYDFEDQHAIYEFDRRHQIYFKDKRVVRQGVQWSRMEMDEMREKQEEEIKKLEPLAQIDAKRELDLFYAEFAPPTFRAESIKRQSAFHDLLTMVARINSFRQRIRELKDYRVEIVAERGLKMGQLGYLHEMVFKLEVELKQVGNDLQDAAARLKICHDADREHQKVLEILKVAEHDKKMTDLARVGCEGSAEDAEDVVRDLAEQVRSILRHRMKEERKTKALQERAKRARTKADELQLTLKETQDMIDMMHYRVRGQLIATRFGPRRVLFYREVDMMLCVAFPLGNTLSNTISDEPEMNARLYVPIHECMNLERGWQQAAIVGMEREDELSKNFYKEELKLCTAELYAMASEDKAMREIDANQKNLKREANMLKDNVILAVENARRFIKKKDGRKELTKRVEEALQKAMRDRHMKELTWSGVGKKPTPMQDWEKTMFRIKMRRPLRKVFIVEMAKQAEAETLSMLAAERAKKATAETFEFVMNEYVKEFMMDLAEETINMGMEAKDRAEANTGIVFADPQHMQYDIYCVLRRWWMTKKADLKKRLETWGVRSAQDAERLEQAKREQAELEMDIERREREAKERDRQNALCSMMAKEEAFSRRFYRDELKQTLGERRLMVQEEQLMKMFLKEEEIEKAAAASKYNVFESSENTGPSEKEMRRAQLKKSGAERNRQKKEIEAMKHEDELAGAIRTEMKKREQLEMLKAEMDLWGGVEEDDEDEDEDEISSDVSSDESVDSGESDGERELRKTEIIARKDLAKTEEEQLDERRWRKSERAARRRQKAKRRAEARREAAERRAAEEWERARQEALVKHASREMEWMEEEEEAKEVEKELFTHDANVRKLLLYGQSKGKEELRMKAIAKKKRDHSDKCVDANTKAETWRKRCSYVELRRRKYLESIRIQTFFMDTSAIAKFYQRWETEILHKRLHQLYFRTLAIIIANKAEIVAGERRMMRVQELLLVNHMDTEMKIKNMEDLWKTHTRINLMRLYRSALGQKIFTKSRKRVLKQVYQGWVRFWLWHKGHKEAFELKYTMIKQELDLRRLYPETRDELERKEFGVTKNGKDNVPEVKRTLLEKHKLRPICCRYCKEFYIEGHNNDVACAFHSGEYRLSCPKTCPGFSDPKMVTTKCMSHRCKRWTCCDVREEGVFGRNGCDMRSHMPPSNGDPIYLEKVKNINKRDAATISDLDEQLEKVRGQNHVLEAFKIKSDQLKEIHDNLTAEREIVKRFEKLKFA